MRAEIVCVGTELLIGQIVNTNAAWLGAELATLGVDVYHQTVVGDNLGRVVEALAGAAGRAERVVVTGGLGPTADDLTVEAIARALGEPLAERPEVRAHLDAHFAARRRPLAPSNYKQTLFPPSAELIPNPYGTAYGCAVKLGGAEVWAFPGVPAEMRAMWEAWAAPRLSGGSTIRSALLKYAGIGEAALAERAGSWLDGENPSVAPYAGNGEVHLRVTAKAPTAAEADAILAPVVSELAALTPAYFGRDAETLESVVVGRLRARRETVALAESCTGGLVASRLTDVAGASNALAGGLVCYTNPVKARLGLDAERLDQEGAVHEWVALDLARGARAELGATWGLGVTGYASGGEGVPEDQVGLVYVAVAGPGREGMVESWRFGATTPRTVVKGRAAQAALDLLRRALVAPTEAAGPRGAAGPPEPAVPRPEAPGPLPPGPDAAPPPEASP